MPKTYPVRKTPDGYVIESVEVFELGTHRDFPYTREWFDRLKQNHDQFESIGFQPPIIIGHNQKFDNKEKAKICGYHNPQLAADNKTVCFDYLIDTDGGVETLGLLKKFPQRSVEVDPEGAVITAIAHLGGTEANFKFPDLNPQMFNAAGTRVVIQFSEEEMTLTEVVEQIKAEQVLSDLDWAFYRKMYAIKDSAEMSVEEKRAALVTLIEEWAGLAKEIIPATVADTEATQMAAVRESEAFKALESQLQSFRIKENKQRLQALRDAGIAPTFVSRFEAMLNAVPTESDSTRKVSFAANRNQQETQFGIAEFLHETLEKMAQAAKAGTLIASLKPSAVPFQAKDGPQILDTPSDDPSQPKNFAASQAVKEHLKAKGINNPTHLDIAAAQKELTKAGTIEVE